MYHLIYIHICKLGMVKNMFLLHAVVRIKVKETKYKTHLTQWMIYRLCWINGLFYNFIILF